MNNALIKEYYNNLLKLKALDDEEAKKQLRTDLFSKILENNILFKFISITSDKRLNEQKIACLKNDSVWCSAQYLLRNNDPSEFDLPVDINKVEQRTPCSRQQIQELTPLFKELSDLCCFTTEVNEFMWQNYANNHSGICCVFEVIDNTDLMPVLYCKKNEVDFTEQLIDAINSRNDKEKAEKLNIFAILPFILKNEENYKNENEIRILTRDAYDDESGVLEGRAAPGKKEALGYKGMSVPYKNCGLKLTAIIFGKNIPEYEKHEIENILINKEDIILSNEV